MFTVFTVYCTALHYTLLQSTNVECSDHYTALHCTECIALKQSRVCFVNLSATYVHWDVCSVMRCNEQHVLGMHCLFVEHGPWCFVASEGFSNAFPLHYSSLPCNLAAASKFSRVGKNLIELFVVSEKCILMHFNVL